jgi:AcrR family transcriptional regulator
MARPKTITDEAIRAAAAEVFLQRGPGASVAEVAERLGVSAPAILKRVGSKEALLRDALGGSEAAPPFVHALGRGPDPDDPGRQLVGLLVQAFAAFRQVAPALAVLRVSGLELRSDRPSPNVLAREALRDWLVAAGVERAPDVAELLLGAIESRSFLEWVDVDPVRIADPEPWIEGLVAAAAPGLRRSP